MICRKVRNICHGLFYNLRFFQQIQAQQTGYTSHFALISPSTVWALFICPVFSPKQFAKYAYLLSISYFIKQIYNGLYLNIQFFFCNDIEV